MLQIIFKHNRYGLNDENDTIVVLPMYENIILVSNMQVYVCKSDGYYDCYDISGKFFKTLNFKSLSDEYANYGFIIVSNDELEIFVNPNDGDNTGRNKIGLLDNRLDVLLEPQYNLINIYSEYILLFSGNDITRDYAVKDWDNPYSYYGVRGGKWGISNLQGQIIVPFEYDFIKVTSKEGIFLVNKGGTMIYTSDDDLGGYSVLGGKWGILDCVDNSGKEIIYDAYQLYNEKIILEKLYEPRGNYNFINAESSFDTFYF